MTESELGVSDTPQGSTPSSDDLEPVSRDPTRGKPRSDGIIVWALLSIATLAYIAFGSVETRIWRFGHLRIEPRSILRVWTIQAESLPRVSHQWLLVALFYSCIAVVVACSLIGAWFLLDGAGTGGRTPMLEDDSDGSGS